MMKLSILCSLFILLNSCRPEKEFLGEGIASYYADKFQGSLTASGERYDSLSFSAAHQSLDFGSRVLVVNNMNGKEIEVAINDRGPFHKDRIIDLSKAAAKELDMLGVGVTSVRIYMIKK